MWTLILLVILILVVAAAAVGLIWQYQQPQVFLYYDPGALVSSTSEARNAAAFFNGVLATPTQIEAAQSAGADWCAPGFGSDGHTYVVLPSDTPGCGKKGVNKGQCSSYSGAKCGVLVFGRKPPSGTQGVLPFNGAQWSQWQWYWPFH